MGRARRLDRQQSHAWLDLRPAGLPPIEAWELDPDAPTKPPRGLEYAVIDTPAGLHGNRLNVALQLADKVIVPLQPSMFDILATQQFLERLADEAVRKGQRRGRDRRDAGRCAHALVRPASPLRRTGLPVLGYVRDTQNYVQIAAHGLTLWDVAKSRVEGSRAMAADRRMGRTPGAEGREDGEGRQGV